MVTETDPYINLCDECYEGRGSMEYCGGRELGDSVSLELKEGLWGEKVFKRRPQGWDRDPDWSVLGLEQNFLKERTCYLVGT